MSKSSEVKKRSSKNSGGCYGVMHSRKKKTERPLNPALIARLDEQNVGRR